ncbi:MAG TPA: DUF4157 domain-containing protein [Longimicrobium sp.]|nr:DUF4157 domain-containing protein [Longimicrobium sp.]
MLLFASPVPDAPLRRSPSAPAPAVAPPVVHDVLRSSGTPLDSAVRARMEPRFGHSFADVRVHADGEAARSARAVGAHAYAVGPHVVFGAGRYAPGSGEGNRLIAHELAHVVQQHGASASIQPKLEIGGTEDVAEREADAAAEAVSRGGAASGLMAGGTPALRRAPAVDPDEELKRAQAESGVGNLQEPTRFETHGLPEVSQYGSLRFTRGGFSLQGRPSIADRGFGLGVAYEDGKFSVRGGSDPDTDDAATTSAADLQGWLGGFLPSIPGAARMPRFRTPRVMDPRQEGPREVGAPDQRNPWLRTLPHPPVGLGAAGLRFPAPRGTAVPPPMLDWTLADLRARAARRPVSAPEIDFGAAGLHFPLAHPASGIRRPWELP